MQNEIKLILGQKGHGKSTYAKRASADITTAFFLDNLAEYNDGLIFETFEDLEHYFQLHREHFRCICRFSEDEDHDKLFEFIWQHGACTLIAEEVDWYTTNELFLKLVKYGRHRELDIIAVSRRPAEVSIMLRSQADEIISFKQSEEADLEWMKKRGFDPEQLKALEKFEFITITN